MIQAKLIRHVKPVEFEDALNVFLEKMSDDLKLVDIKYSTTYEGNEDVFSALVVYEQ